MAGPGGVFNTYVMLQQHWTRLAKQSSGKPMYLLQGDKGIMRQACRSQYAHQGACICPVPYKRGKH